MAKYTLKDLGNKKIMANNIQKHVERTGKTPKTVASEIGFPYTTFRDWLNGNCYPKMSAIEVMSNYFNIKKSDLIEDKSNEPETIHTIAAHATRDLTEDEMKKVMEYAEFLRAQRK